MVENPVFEVMFMQSLHDLEIVILSEKIANAIGVSPLLPGMKRIRKIAVLATVVGLFAYRIIETPVFADSKESAAAAQTEQASYKPGEDGLGTQSYSNHCAICHGEHREGILPAFPPLLGIKRQMNDQQISDLIHKGKGRMPAFPKLQSDELAQLLRYLAVADTSAADLVAKTGPVHSSASSQPGGSLFQQNCAFCHGRDAMGGETGPDLTRSKLVLSDKDGDKISEVVRNGRPEKKMPAFNFSGPELLSLASFIHAQEVLAASQKGGRRGVDISDLQTGNVDKGKQYFNGAGGCAKCHSATGDLAGLAKRYEGLQLEERMLYPQDVKSHVTVTLASGKKTTGVLAYLDEFTVGLRDSDGTYHSWLVSKVKVAVDSPVTAHVDLFSKYTDDDIHNLMAYMQTLR